MYSNASDIVTFHRSNISNKSMKGLQGTPGNCKLCGKTNYLLQSGLCLACTNQMPKPKLNSSNQNYSNPPQYSNPPKVNYNAICKHFLEGNCKFGNNCHFAHVIILPQHNKPSQNTSYQQSKPTNPAPTTPLYYPNPPKEPCKFYLQGLCKNGKQCKFKH